MTTLSRPVRPLHRSPSDAPPIHSAQAGPRTSVRPSRLQRRMDTLSGQRKASDAAARYALAVGRAIVAALEGIDAAARDRVRVAGFLAGLEAMAAEDPRLNAAFAALAPALAPEAAAVLLEDLERGPKVIAALAHDPLLAERLAQLPAFNQALELGRLISTL